MFGSPKRTAQPPAGHAIDALADAAAGQAQAQVPRAALRLGAGKSPHTPSNVRALLLQSRTAVQPPASSAAAPRPDAHTASGAPARADTPSPRMAQNCASLDLHLADRAITSAEDMASVPFESCINDAIDLAAHLAASIAVLATQPTHKTAVLLVAETATADVIDAVLARLAHRGIALATEGSQVWQCTAPVLMAICSHDLKPEHARVIRSRQQDSTKSALWQSFVGVVEWAHQQNAADIDFVVSLANAQSEVFFKIDGRYITLPRWSLPTETLVAMLGTAWQHSQGGADTKFELRNEQQCRIDVTTPSGTRLRLRWASMATDRGVTVTLRIQRMGALQVVSSLREAGFLEDQLEVFARAVVGKGGLTTLAGTVGSGKSVTMAILMSRLPANLKVVTFEDPVEIENLRFHQKTISRDLVGDDDGGFQSAVGTLFRSAFDIFMLGEVRDTVTGRVVRAVLESGHSGYTTTHAPSAIGIFTKFASPQVGIPLDVLAIPGMLRLNVCQSLLLKNCSCAVQPDELLQDLEGKDRLELEQMLHDIESLYALPAHLLRLRNPAGCPLCRKPDLPSLWGYSGRTVAAEMIEPDETMCELVLKSDMVGLRRYWRSLSDGVITSPHTIGKTAMEVAMHKAATGQIDPREVQQHFDSFRSLASKAQNDRALSMRRLAAQTAQTTNT